MAEAPAPIIYLHDIHRRYVQGETSLVILNGAKLALWPGQSVALVGPSGAGKSTLLHIAGLLEHPDDGEVYVDGMATSALSDAERTQIRRTEIGFVYQSHRLLPEFSARRKRDDAADDPRPEPRARPGRGRSRYCPISASRSARPTGRRNCRAASNSASRFRAQLPTRRASCSPTSRPAISIRTPPNTCSRR